MPHDEHEGEEHSDEDEDHSDEDEADHSDEDDDHDDDEHAGETAEEHAMHAEEGEGGHGFPLVYVLFFGGFMIMLSLDQVIFKPT
jgi:hypothetical protein